MKSNTLSRLFIISSLLIAAALVIDSFLREASSPGRHVEKPHPYVNRSSRLKKLPSLLRGAESAVGSEENEPVYTVSEPVRPASQQVIEMVKLCLAEGEAEASKSLQSLLEFDSIEAADRLIAVVAGDVDEIPPNQLTDAARQAIHKAIRENPNQEAVGKLLWTRFAGAESDLVRDRLAAIAHPFFCASMAESAFTTGDTEAAGFALTQMARGEGRANLQALMSLAEAGHVPINQLAQALVRWGNNSSKEGGDPTEILMEFLRAPRAEQRALAAYGLAAHAGSEPVQRAVEKVLGQEQGTPVLVHLERLAGIIKHSEN